MNDKNLIPFPERTESELREIQRKGGEASGKSRRLKRDLRRKIDLILSMPCADNDREVLEAMGISPGEMDNEMILAVSLFQKAKSGDMRAFDKIMQILGEDVASQELKLRKKEFKMKSAKPNGEKVEELPQLYKALMALAGDNDE